MFDVFISYASPDLPSARALYDEFLCRTMPRRFRPYLDAVLLGPECDFDVELPKVLRTCAITAVLVSERTPAAHYQRQEYILALELERRSSGTSHRVVPVWLNDVPTEHRPFGLMTRQGIRVTEEHRVTGQIADGLVGVLDRIAAAHAERTWLAETPIPAIKEVARQALDFLHEAHIEGRITDERRQESTRTVLDETVRRILDEGYRQRLNQQTIAIAPTAENE